jgi:hypothetical protein
MSFKASVFSKKEMVIIIGISVIVSLILYITYVTAK